RLVRIAVLNGPEPTHRAARWVVGVGNDAVDGCVWTLVRPDREARCVGDHSGGAGRVGAAVEDDPCLDVDQLSVLRRAVLVMKLARMAMHVADEGFRPRVRDLD